MAQAAVPLAAAGAGLKAAGALQAGRAGYKSGMYNAAVSERNAQTTAADTAAEEMRIRREARLIAGEAIAGQGMSGLQLGTGSALEVLRESAINAELDVLTTRRKGASAAAAMRQDAVMSRMGAKQARTAGFIGAASALIGGASSISGMKTEAANAAAAGG